MRAGRGAHPRLPRDGRRRTKQRARRGRALTSPRYSRRWLLPPGPERPRRAHRGCRARASAPQVRRRTPLRPASTREGGSRARFPRCPERASWHPTHRHRLPRSDRRSEWCFPGRSGRPRGPRPRRRGLRPPASVPSPASRTRPRAYRPRRKAPRTTRARTRAPLRAPPDARALRRRRAPTPQRRPPRRRSGSVPQAGARGPAQALLPQRAAPRPSTTQRSP